MGSSLYSDRGRCPYCNHEPPEGVDEQEVMCPWHDREGLLGSLRVLGRARTEEGTDLLMTSSPEGWNEKMKEYR